MMGHPRATIRRRAGMLAAVCGGLAAAVCVAAAWQDPARFFPAYLASALWIWSISVGGIALGLLFHLTGGRWGQAGRPWFETASRAMPLVCLLFIPLAFGLPHLYPWTEPDYFEGMENVANRQWYLSSPFFLVRSAIYFAIWIALSLMVGGLPGRHRPQRAIVGGEAVAGLSAVALLLTITWAGFDWLMSINPEFTSSLFGLLIGVGALLCGTGFVVAGSMWGRRHRSLPQRHEQKTLSDLGNLLLTMVLMWTYLSFSQYLLMWSGNLPAEAKYYLDRNTGGWQFLSLMLAAGGFAIPMMMMLSTHFKQAPRPLGLLAAWLVLFRLLELDWFILPCFSPGELQLSWWAVAAPVATGGLGFAFVAWDVPQAGEISSASEGDSHER